ncbi:unnamed protein product [Arctia plantaginis]|uniref:CLIP domain-containing serine protease n=1 Tax=Arctia plantaginis TaxID=874455 RepID=A0A8S1AMG4_ARCPL|nr:unnamed protein product [Arctia plantaginis]CAB3249019.1 unnamed protein product [Arctia plantaginis]
MLKFMITVTVFQQLMLQTECFYPGDNCFRQGKHGVCLPVPQCKNIDNEIRRAGNPVPIYMRNKLQSLACGFHYDVPMICCFSIAESDYDIHLHRVTANSGYPAHSGENFNFVGAEEHEHDYDNHNDNVECTPRITLSNKSGPNSVEAHPNLGMLPKQCGSIESDRIIGGNRTKLFEMPWMVLLSYDTSRGIKLKCGGTIINKWYVLTAAHCVSYLSSRMRLDGVIIGEYDVRGDPDCEISDDGEYCAPSVINATIDTIIAHPGYTPQTLADDIALIRLSEALDFSPDSRKPICLPITRELQSRSMAGLNGVVAGWGVTEDGLQSPVLLSVELPILTQRACQDAYNGTIRISEKQLCAGGIKNKDSCGGDSGGPLLYPGQYSRYGLRYIQHGIVSFGSKRCGTAGFPGVYTNVAYYMDWILDNMRS